MSISASPTAFGAQLSAQAGSRHPTGTPLFIEKFDATALNNYVWAQSGGGTGTVTLYNAANANQNVWSRASLAVLSSGVAGGYIQLAKHTQLTSNTRYGIEVLFGFPYTMANLRARCLTFNIRLAYFDHHGTWYNAQVAYVPSIGTLRLPYYGGLYEGLTIKTDDLNAENPIGGATLWQNAKLVIDVSTKKFVQLYWNEFEIDLSQYSIPTIPTVAIGTCISPEVLIEDLNPPTQFTTYIGGFIFTNNE